MIRIPLKTSLLKLAFCATALIYMAVDVWIWHGPIWQLLHAEQARDTSQLMAEVSGTPITRAQFARYEAEQDALAGRTAPQAARRSLYLMDMVRQTLLRTRARYNDKNLPPCRAEAEEEVASLASRYPDAATFEQALVSQGYTKESFTNRVEVRLRTAALLERALAPHCEPSEEELENAHENVKEELRRPASREVKHIFLSTLNKDADEVRALAESLLERVTTGKEDFSTLARVQSEDERSALQGGDLGTLTDDSSRPLPELPLFGENAIPAGVPTLAQSKWGWHILLAGEVQPARIPDLKECRESLLTALRSARREMALRDYLNSDFNNNKKRIIFYHR